MKDSDLNRIAEKLFSYKNQEGEDLFEWSFEKDSDPNIWLYEESQPEDEEEDPDCFSWYTNCTQLQFRIKTAECTVVHFYEKERDSLEAEDRDVPRFYTVSERHSVDISDVVSCPHISLDIVDSTLFKIAVFCGKCLGAGEWLDGILGCGSSWSSCDDDLDREEVRQLSKFVKQEFSRYLDKDCTCGRLVSKILLDFSDSYL